MKKSLTLIGMKLPRMILNNLRSFIALAVVSAVGIALLIGLNNAQDLLYESIDEFRGDYSDADITMTVDLTGADMKDALMVIDGVEGVTERLAWDALVKKSDGRIVTLRLFTYNEGDFPLMTCAEEAAAPEGAIKIYIAEKFAGRNAISAGDGMTFMSPGGERALAVAGIAVSPSSTCVKRDIYTWSDNIDFGCAYIGREDLYALTGLDGMYNQLMIRTNEGSDDSAVLEKTLAAAGSAGVNVLRASDYVNSDAKAWYDINLEPIGIISGILPPVFFLVMLLFVYISLSQTIGKSRKSIGVLRALGFGKNQIVSLFAAYAFSITVVAAVIGFIIGRILSDMVYDVYAGTIGVPPLPVSINASVAAVGIIACVLTGQAATFFLVRQISGISAASAMRPVTDFGAKAPLLLRTLFKGLGSRAKLMIATIFRKKQRFALSTVSLTAATFLIIISLSVIFSQNFILRQTFINRMRYDAQVRFAAGIDGDKRAEITALSEIAECDFALMFAGEAGEKGETLMFCGMEKESSLLSVFGEDYEEISVPDDGVVLEKNFADRNGLRPGDEVLIGSEYVRVSAVTAEDINYVQYCPFALAARLSGTENANMVFCTLAEGCTQEQFLDAITKIEGCAGVTFCDMQYKSGKVEMDLVNLAMTIIICCAVIIGFVVVYNTSLYSYMDWQREYAILRAEGFGVGQVSVVSITEVLFEYIISLLFSLPLGVLASGYLLKALDSDIITYPLADVPVMCAVTALIMLLFILFGFVLSVSRLKRMNIPLVIKEE